MELTRRLKTGERATFDEVYLGYFEHVYGYLSAALRDPHEAEDLAQGVFLKLFEANMTYESDGAQRCRAWLFRVARNAAIDLLRKRAWAEPTAPHELDRRREAEDLKASARTLERRFMRELLRMVTPLGVLQRQVVVLRYMLDMSYEDIALILNRSKGSIRQAHSRALRRLELSVAALAAP